MKPKLWSWMDLWLLWIPALIAGLLVGAFVWNYTSPNGEPIPLVGWVISAVVAWSCVGIVVAFYLERHKFNREYRYTTAQGVDCYYAPGTVVYERAAVEAETARVMQAWGVTAIGVLCEFLAAGDFWTLGPWRRHVYGAQQGSAIVVGQGGRALTETAFAHELSHVLIDRSRGYEVPEAEAHQLMQAKGIA